MTLTVPRVLVAGLLVLGASDAGARPKPTKRVAGRAVLVSSICGGGAAIPPDAWARLPPPQPIGGREFLIVAGERISPAEPAARFTTRADGSFVTRLAPGTWCFFDAARRPGDDRPTPVAVAAPGSEADCLAAEKRRCDLVLAVQSDVAHAEITFTGRCPEAWNQPCYRGPMPP
jgi:hypothetical protein